MGATAVSGPHPVPPEEPRALSAAARRPSVLERLDALPLFHTAVRRLHLRSLLGMLLHAFPRHFELHGHGARYRSRFLETFLLADEIFRRQVYDQAIDPAEVTTFLDLGSNVGLFAVLLVHLTGRRDLRGLLIDANPAMVEESRWHLAANGLGGVVALQGLVGSTGDGQTSPFYLLPSNLGSSQFPIHEPHKPAKGDWRRILVPAVRVDEHWSRHFGAERCDLLKIDIEGSEARFIQSERRFLERVGRIILEWHKWLVSKEDIDRELEGMGFLAMGTLTETTTTGIAWYRRDATSH
jgi:FkbM family methyltransferase